MSEIQNNNIRFNYSEDPTTLMGNSWITTNTDTTQNTVTGVGESYWRTITFNFTGKEPFSGVFRIKVNENGFPDTSIFENISGDEVTSVSYSNETLIFEGVGAAGECSDFKSAIENTVYTEKEIAGTWSYVQSDYGITHYWRTITFDFTGKSSYAGVFRIEVDSTGVPITTPGDFGCNFVNISGDAVENCNYQSQNVYIDNTTLSTAAELSNFAVAIENTVYTETEVAGTWSYAAYTTTETVYDHYEVELYVNSDVTTFPNNLFYANSNITSIEFDTYSITSIEDGNGTSNGAFYECGNLSSIILPNNLEYIGNYALTYTNISQITLPTTLNEIGNWVFNNTHISQITLPASLNEIGTGALSINNLSITSLAAIPPILHLNAIRYTSTLTIHETALQSYINSDWGNYVASISTIETPTYNNVLKFNYSEDPTTFLNNLWVNSCTDTSANTIVGVGEHTEPGYMTYSELEEVAVGFDALQRKTMADTGAAIEKEGGLEIFLTGKDWTEAQISTFISIYGDNSDDAYLICRVETNSFDYEDIMAFIETEIIVADYYEVTLYINSALNTFETMMFAENTNLLTIDFEYDVTYIGDDAFNGCTSIESVTINTPVPPTLGDDVFKNVTATLYVPYPSLTIYRQEMGDIFPTIKPTKLPAQSYGFNLSRMGNVDYVQQGTIMIK